MYKSPIELLVTDIQNQIVKQQDEEISTKKAIWMAWQKPIRSGFP